MRRAAALSTVPARAAPHVALSPPLPARPRATDRDGDGHIDPDELSTVMGRMGMQPTDAQLKELIESVDFDNNGKIEFEEFATLMARRMLISDGDYELKQAFKIFDADESGKLDVAEVRAMFTHNNNPFNPQARPPAAPARPPCPPLPPACRLARAARLARRPSARDALPSTAHPSSFHRHRASSPTRSTSSCASPTPMATAGSPSTSSSTCPAGSCRRCPPASARCLEGQARTQAPAPGTPPPRTPLRPRREGAAVDADAR